MNYRRKSFSGKEAALKRILPPSKCLLQKGNIETKEARRAEQKG
jgi:hypothetical protein